MSDSFAMVCERGKESESTINPRKWGEWKINDKKLGSVLMSEIEDWNKKGVIDSSMMNLKRWERSYREG